MMHKNLFKKLFLLILSSNIVISDSIQDQLDSIILIDESDKSEMQQRAVVGCDNTLKIAEVKCSKKRDTNNSTTKIENLPKSDKKDDSKDVEMEKIKSQLNDILKQLAELQKVKENNKELREELKKVTLIQKLVNKDEKSTRRAKEIKVLQVNRDHVIIKVQEGESLSKYAQKYYGNSKKYHNILRANPDKIDKSLQIYIDDALIIPTSISYRYKEITITPIEEKEFQETIIPLEENEIDIVEEVIYVEEEPLVIKVKKGVDIFQLALEHYGDEKQYYYIYNANRGIIGANLKLKEGMELQIPIIK
jgi:LysM repeat protein